MSPQNDPLNTVDPLANQENSQPTQNQNSKSQRVQKPAQQPQINQVQPTNMQAQEVPQKTSSIVDTIIAEANQSSGAQPT